VKNLLLFIINVQDYTRGILNETTIEKDQSMVDISLGML